MNFRKLIKKIKGAAKTREERDFIKEQEGNRKRAIEIVKVCADELEEIGYFLQPTIMLDPEQRISHSSGLVAKANLDITPMTFEIWKDIKHEKCEAEIRKGLTCKDGCDAPHENCPHPVQSDHCAAAAIERCGKCLGWKVEQRKAAIEREKAEAATAAPTAEGGGSA